MEGGVESPLKRRKLATRQGSLKQHPFISTRSRSKVTNPSYKSNTSSLSSPADYPLILSPADDPYFSHSDKKLLPTSPPLCSSPLSSFYYSYPQSPSCTTPPPSRQFQPPALLLSPLVSPTLSSPQISTPPPKPLSQCLPSPSNLKHVPLQASSIINNLQTEKIPPDTVEIETPILKEPKFEINPTKSTCDKNQLPKLSKPKFQKLKSKPKPKLKPKLTPTTPTSPTTPTPTTPTTVPPTPPTTVPPTPPTTTTKSKEPVFQSPDYCDKQKEKTAYLPKKNQKTTPTHCQHHPSAYGQFESEKDCLACKCNKSIGMVCSPTTGCGCFWVESECSALCMCRNGDRCLRKAVLKTIKPLTERLKIIEKPLGHGLLCKQTIPPYTLLLKKEETDYINGAPKTVEEYYCMCVNRSNDPNATWESWFDSNGSYVGLFSCREIQRNEQITTS